MSASEDWARTRELRKRSSYTSIPRKNASRRSIFCQCPGCGEFNIPIDELNTRKFCPECEAKKKEENDQVFGRVGQLGFAMLTKESEA